MTNTETPTDYFHEVGQIGGEREPAENGWRRDSVWAGTSNAGDEALQEFTATYVHPSKRSVELSYYVFGIDDPDDDGNFSRWSVDCFSHWWTDTIEDADDDYSNDAGDVRVFESIEEAARAARSLALTDEAWKLGTP